MNVTTVETDRHVSIVATTGNAAVKPYEFNEALKQSMARREVSQNAQVLGLLIATYADNHGARPCWPSQKTLASVSGKGRGTITRTLAELVDQGWLLVDMSSCGKRRRVNRYWLRIPESVAGAGEIQEPPRPGAGEIQEPPRAVLQEPPRAVPNYSMNYSRGASKRRRRGGGVTQHARERPGDDGSARRGSADAERSTTTGKKKEARAIEHRSAAGHSEIDPPHTAVAKQSAGEGGRERSKELQDDQFHCFGTPRDGDGATTTGSGAGGAKPDKDIRDAALRYRDDIMRKAEDAEDAERERFVVERAANPSRCLCGFVDTPEAPMSGHLRGNPDREQHRVVLPLREVKAT